MVWKENFYEANDIKKQREENMYLFAVYEHSVHQFII